MSDKLPTARSSRVPDDISTPNYAVVLDRLVRDPSVPMERVERALALVEHQRQTEAKAQFGVAMAEAQQEMGAISRDMTNPSTRSRYASLASIDSVIRPIYSKHGLAPSFDTRPSEKGENWIKIVAEVSHVGGHSREYSIDMPADGIGAKGGAIMTRTHATMSAVTYGRRGLLKMIFNLAEGDDDGNAATASEDEELVSEMEVAMLRKRIEQVEQSEQRVCAFYKIDKLENLPASQFDHAMKKLDAQKQ